MAKNIIDPITINLPNTFSFTCQIPVRISDINYGGHVGNDALLSMIHEARMQFLKHLGASELHFFGTGTIMTEVSIKYKCELFYGEVVSASVSVGELSKVGFDILYHLEKEIDNKKITVAVARTGILCYDYQNKKVVAIPEEAKMKFLS